MNLVEQNGAIVGFRPEHLKPLNGARAEADSLVVPFRVTRVEYLGSDELIYGVLEPPFPEEKIVAKLAVSDPFHTEQGERVEFAIGKRDVRRFDRATGLRADGPGGGA
jgi:multiple sugar transport system ATP-binding protein